MIYILLVLAFFIGYYLREIMGVLRRIEARLGLLNLTQAKQEPKATPASFVEPMTKAEMIAMMEEERVEAMNRD